MESYSSLPSHRQCHSHPHPESRVTKPFTESPTQKATPDHSRSKTGIERGCHSTGHSFLKRGKSKIYLQFCGRQDQSFFLEFRMTIAHPFNSEPFCRFCGKIWLWSILFVTHQFLPWILGSASLALNMNEHNFHRSKIPPHSTQYQAIVTHIALLEFPRKG